MLVDNMYAADPTLDGDTVYQQARAIVAAEIQNITYTEFLPHLLGGMMFGAYAGYDPLVDPRMALEFAGAAYRFGHSTVSDVTEKLDEYGNASGEVALKDTFFLTPDHSPPMAVPMACCATWRRTMPRRWMSASSTTCATSSSTRRWSPTSPRSISSAAATSACRI